ncbi:MAG: LytR/AlgR family response regulator transcription factor [Bacteroidia bacterium]
MRATIIDYSPTPSQIRQQSGSLIIRTDRKLICIKTADIILIKGLADYVILKTLTEKYVIKSTMKEMFASLPSNIFARTHRSFIVNMQNIKTVDGSIILLAGKGYQYLVPIGKVFEKAFKKVLLS